MFLPHVIKKKTLFLFPEASQLIIVVKTSLALLNYIMHRILKIEPNSTYYH